MCNHRLLLAQTQKTAWRRQTGLLQPRSTSVSPLDKKSIKCTVSCFVPPVYFPQLAAWALIRNGVQTQHYRSLIGQKCPSCSRTFQRQRPHSMKFDTKGVWSSSQHVILCYSASDTSWRQYLSLNSLRQTYMFTRPLKLSSGRWLPFVLVFVNMTPLCLDYAEVRAPRRPIHDWQSSIVHLCMTH